MGVEVVFMGRSAHKSVPTRRSMGVITFDILELEGNECRRRNESPGDHFLIILISICISHQIRFKFSD
jgi:hypothetical protein